jgi:hypothetical protein
MSVQDFISDLAKLGVVLALKPDGTLSCRSRKPISPEIVASVQERKPELLAALTARLDPVSTYALESWRWRRGEKSDWSIRTPSEADHAAGRARTILQELAKEHEAQGRHWLLIAYYRDRRPREILEASRKSQHAVGTYPEEDGKAAA